MPGPNRARSPYVTHRAVSEPGELAALLDLAWLETGLGVRRPAGGAPRPVIVKPNWFSPHRGSHTSAETLDFVLSAIPGPKLVVEGHNFARHYGGQDVTPRNARASWPWLKEQDAEFLRRTGLGRVLEGHGAAYVNVTDEVYAGRTADAGLVRAIVEPAAGPLGHPELLAQVPQVLFDLAGQAVLLDLAKIKVPPVDGAPVGGAPGEDAAGDGFSLSLKNLFGLIAEPARFAYHRDLASSVTDVAALYGALFPVLGLAEGIHEYVLAGPRGATETPWGRYDLVEGQGLVVLGWPLSEVDLLAGRLFDRDLASRELIRLARQRGL